MACGNIVAKGQGKCRESCADRWGEALKDRDRCDDKCISAYESFEKECVGKADNLETVYELRLKAASARKKCHESYCDEFPTVWLKAASARKKCHESYCDEF